MTPILCGEDPKTAVLHIINDLSSDPTLAGKGFGYRDASTVKDMYVRQVRADHPRLCEECVHAIERRGLL
jgi:hypothetical protein